MSPFKLSIPSYLIMSVLPTGVAQASNVTSTTFQSPHQVSDGNSQGEVIANTPTDPVAFFGGTPALQGGVTGGAGLAGQLASSSANGGSGPQASALRAGFDDPGLQPFEGARRARA